MSILARGWACVRCGRAYRASESGRWICVCGHNRHDQAKRTFILACAACIVAAVVAVSMILLR